MSPEDIALARRLRALGCPVAATQFEDACCAAVRARLLAEEIVRAVECAEALQATGNHPTPAGYTQR